MAGVKAILFDLGNVCLPWDPARVYRRHFASEAETRAFLDNVCTMAWHGRHDAGAPMALTAAELSALHPHHSGLIKLWSDEWWAMHGEPIAETIAIIEQFAQQNMPLFALTNMPAEKWPGYLERYDWLRHFNDVIVSGEEGVIKPQPQIFAITLARMGGRAPEEVVFIDDNAANIAAADALGFATHHFTDPAQLAPALRAMGLSLF